MTPPDPPAGARIDHDLIDPANTAWATGRQVQRWNLPGRWVNLRVLTRCPGGLGLLAQAQKITGMPEDDGGRHVGGRIRRGA